MVDVVAPALIVGGAAYLGARIYDKPQSQGQRNTNKRAAQHFRETRETSVDSKHQNLLDAKEEIAVNNEHMRRGLERGQPRDHRNDRFGTKTVETSLCDPLVSTSGHRDKAGGGAPSAPDAGPQPTGVRKEDVKLWNRHLKWRSSNGKIVKFVPFDKAVKYGPEYERRGDKIRYRMWRNNQLLFSPWMAMTPARKKIVDYSVRNRGSVPDLKNGAWEFGAWEDDRAYNHIDRLTRSGASEVYGAEDRQEPVCFQRNKHSFYSNQLDCLNETKFEGPEAGHSVLGQADSHRVQRQRFARHSTPLAERYSHGTQLTPMQNAAVAWSQKFKQDMY